MKVKGTWLVDYIKMIRANPDKNWDKYLTDEDREIVDSKVLASGWYPYESFNRLGKAVFQELAGGDLKIVKSFGRLFADNILQVYKNLCVEGDPAATISKVFALQRTFFKDIPALIEPVEKESNRFVVRINVSDMEREMGAVDAFAYQYAGMIERLVELCGNTNKKIEVREIDSGFEIESTWS